MKNNRGFAPLFIILAVVLIGGITLGIVNRDILKTYFQTGDVPTEEQFGNTIDSAINVPEDSSADNQKEYNPTKEYLPGDTAITSELVYQAKVLTQDQKEFSLNTVQPVMFTWTPLVPQPTEPVTYRLKVWQLMQGQNGSQAMQTNQPIITKEVADATEATVSGIYTGPCKPPYLCDFIWSVEVLKKEKGSSETGEAAAPVEGSADTLGTD